MGSGIVPKAGAIAVNKKKLLPSWSLHFSETDNKTDQKKKKQHLEYWTMTSVEKKNTVGFWNITVRVTKEHLTGKVTWIKAVRS